MLEEYDRSLRHSSVINPSLLPQNSSYCLLPLTSIKYQFY